MQCFLGDSDSGCLALAIAKKILDENRFRNAQKMTDYLAPYFKMGDRV